MKSLLRGKLLDRRYRVLRTLAKGGFGETYIAEDTRLPGNPGCVVKHLKPSDSNPKLLENAKRLFLIEAETLQRLGKHDQIPQLMAYFEENREFYLVQELIQGQTLTQELQPGDRWSESQVCQMLEGILGILSFVHQHGVIHRDIKPDNIIRREPDKALVLVDFGTVKQVVVAQTQVSTTIIAGTPGYMPTEQGRGKPRPSSDIYALGMIGIQAVTGLSLSQIQEDANTGELVWQPWAACSDELAAILARMVRYHFKDRYPSAEEVLQALAPLLSQINGSVDAHIKELEVKELEVEDKSSSTATELQSPDAWMPAEEQASPDAILEPEQFPSTVESKGTIISRAPSAGQSQEAEVVAEQRAWRLPRVSAWGVAIATILGIAGVAGVLYVQQQQRLMQQQQRLLTETQALQKKGNYRECLKQAQLISSSNILIAQAGQTVLGDCEFALAQQLAKQGKYQEAITTANTILATHPTYQKRQPLINQWSAQILKLATETYQAGKFDQAIALLKGIPQGSSAYSTAQTTLQKWNVEWTTNDKHLKAANKAIKEKKWNVAIDEAKQLTTPYWKQKSTAIMQKANDAIAAAQPISLPPQNNAPAQSQYSEPPPEPQYQPPHQGYEPPPQPYDPPTQSSEQPPQSSEPPPSVFRDPGSCSSPPCL